MISSQNSLPATPIKDILINVEYIKHLNLNIPHTPELFLTSLPQPKIVVSINVNAQQIEKDKPRFEIVVIIQCTSTTNIEEQPEPLIIFEMQLQYGAIITIPTLQTSNLPDILMVHTPDLLFPEIRNLILNLTRSSNLPPVLLQRVDFAHIWKEKLESQNKKDWHDF